VIGIKFIKYKDGYFFKSKEILKRFIRKI
jgi:hypothetical protein